MEIIRTCCDIFGHGYSFFSSSEINRMRMLELRGPLMGGEENCPPERNKHWALGEWPGTLIAARNQCVQPSGQHK